jgi:hypothetical protein
MASMLQSSSRLESASTLGSGSSTSRKRVRQTHEHDRAWTNSVLRPPLGVGPTLRRGQAKMQLLLRPKTTQARALAGSGWLAGSYSTM